MKLFPSAKQFGIAFVIAFVLNIQKLLEVGNLAGLIGFLISTSVYAIIVLIIIRIVTWIGKKMGIGK